MGNVDGISGRGMNAVEVGGKSGADGSISEMSLHHAEFALSTALSSVKLNSLVLYHLEFVLMCPIPINISNNTRVFEIYDGIVDEESGGGGGVENVEVIVFDPRIVEIGRGMCLCVKGNRELRVALFANSYNVSIHTDLSKSDIACHLILTILIEEDKGILLHITVVIFTPPISWMIRIVKLVSKLGDVGDGTRHGGEENGRVVLSKPNWFIVLYVIVRHVVFDFVKNLGDEKEMFHSGVIVERSGEDLVVKLSVPQNVQGWEEILHPSRKRPSDMLLIFHVFQQGSALFSHMANLSQRGDLPY